MTRNFLGDTPAPAGTAPAAVPPQSPAPAAQPTAPKDALAGALPAWDLLPATPFLRRVK